MNVSEDCLGGGHESRAFRIDEIPLHVDHEQAALIAPKLHFMLIEGRNPIEPALCFSIQVLVIDICHSLTPWNPESLEFNSETQTLEAKGLARYTIRVEANEEGEWQQNEWVY